MTDIYDRATDEWGTCVACGGHGSLMVIDPNTREITGSKECPLCDGTDHATGEMERAAEDAAAYEQFGW